MLKPRDVPYRDILKYWDAIDKRGTDFVGARTLAKLDRFYLLVKVLRRHDLLHPWLYARCREVEADPDGRLDLWAREHYKSTIITFAGTIQEIINDPEITICIFSHTGHIAKGFLRQIKEEIDRNAELRQLFPDVFYENPERDSPSWSIDNGLVVKRRSNPKESTVEAWGLIDSQPVSKHYRLRIYDDTVTDKSVSTPEQNQKSIDAYSLSQALGVQGGREWGIGTRYSFADAYDWMLKRHMHVPRIYAATDNGLKDGEPVFFSAEEWAKRQIRHTDQDIACQYLQNPIAGEQRMFNISDLRVYEVRPETLNVYVLVDPARSVKKDSANTAIAVIGLDYAANKYLLDGYNHKMDLAERWSRTREMYVKWKRQPGVQSVKVGYEAYGAQADLDYFKEKMATQGPGFPISELRWPRDGELSKVDRVQRLGPDFKQHKFFLPYPTEEKKLTSAQRKMVEQGYSYRVSKQIRYADENRQMYDITEHFKQQVHYFPFGGLKDLVDAAARIYDMDPSGPIMIDQSQLEPEYT